MVNYAVLVDRYAGYTSSRARLLPRLLPDTLRLHNAWFILHHHMIILHTYDSQLFANDATILCILSTNPPVIDRQQGN